MHHATSVLRRPSSACAALRSRAVHQNGPKTRPNLAHLPPQAQPTVSNDDGSKTLRVRKHGHRSLPLPPMMDPIAVEARMKYKKAKPWVDKENLTEFQKDLAANPFAQALATPVRQCNITRVRLPSHFLLPFSTTVETSDIPDAIFDSPKRVQARLNPIQASDAPRTSSIGSSSYILNRRDLLEYLNSHDRWTQILTLRMVEGYAKRAGKKNVKRERDWMWDSQMEGYVRRKLQSDVDLQLRACLESDVDRPLVIELEAAPDVRVASVLLLSALTESGQERLRQKVDLTTIPCYNLPTILTPERLSDLKLGEDLHFETYLAVIADPQTARLLMALRRLQAYLDAG